MKSYILVLLKTGNNEDADEKFRSECFAGHMENMDRMVEEGQLIVAGPMGENSENLEGIFILNVATIEEAEKILESDPAIAAELLTAKLYPWYGSAALPEYLDASDKVWKTGF